MSAKGVFHTSVEFLSNGSHQCVHTCVSSAALYLFLGGWEIHSGGGMVKSLN